MTTGYEKVWESTNEKINGEHRVYCGHFLLLVTPFLLHFYNFSLNNSKENHNNSQTLTKTHLDVLFHMVSQGYRVPQGPFSEGSEGWRGVRKIEEA